MKIANTNKIIMAALAASTLISAHTAVAASLSSGFEEGRGFDRGGKVPTRSSKTGQAHRTGQPATKTGPVGKVGKAGKTGPTGRDTPLHLIPMNAGACPVSYLGTSRKIIGIDCSQFTEEQICLTYIKNNLYRGQLQRSYDMERTSVCLDLFEEKLNL